MRRSVLRFSHPIGKQIGCFSSSAGGRGRGRAAAFPPPPENPIPPTNTNSSPPPISPGYGRGGGSQPPHPPPGPTTNPNLPSGRGRGGLGAPSPPPHVQQQHPPPGPTTNPSSFPSGKPSPSPPVDNNNNNNGQQNVVPKKPIFFVKMEEEKSNAEDDPLIFRSSSENRNLPSSVLSVLSGAGRGKPFIGNQGAQITQLQQQPQQENRHIRPRPQQEGGDTTTSSNRKKKLSREEALKNAMGILSKGDDGGRGGRGGRGRGRGRGRGMRGGGRGRQRRNYDEEEEEDDDGLDTGDDAAGERFAQRVGPEVMNELAEGFEDISDTVLPTPEYDAYIDAMHTNYMIECEPEYMVDDFESNPDIDEKPIIPLRDAFEKMKPFLMAYENIQSQEEWEEIIEATMAHVPLVQEIVDYYAGPDTVTAKQQTEELERVAKTLPQSAPNSVKRFTDRAVQSLKSNPGWGFDKKCQFMDKLVWEVSQQYK